jgi:hypothetical protein
MGKAKGHFSKRGTRETPWGEKAKNLSTTLSEEGYRSVKERVKALGLSVSEILERWGRGYTVDIGRSQGLPANLDISREWKPSSSEVLDKADAAVAGAEESLAKATNQLAQVSSDLEELRQTVEQDQEQMQLLMHFVQKLASGDIQLEDLDELTALVNFNDKGLERLTAIIQLFNGGRKTNGV